MAYKMKGFSGFGNSPLKTHKKGHTLTDSFTRTSYHEPDYPKKKKRKKNRKDFKYTKVGKFFGLHKIKSRKHKRSGPKIACGPRGCR